MKRRSVAVFSLIVGRLTLTFCFHIVIFIEVKQKYSILYEDLILRDEFTISRSLQLDSPDSCTEFVLSGAVLGLAQWKVAPNNIVLIANFTEAGTGIVETTISRTVVVHQALKLEFLPYTPKFFTLGLPYHGKVNVRK